MTELTDLEIKPMCINIETIYDSRKNSKQNSARSCEKGNKLPTKNSKYKSGKITRILSAKSSKSIKNTNHLSVSNDIKDKLLYKTKTIEAQETFNFNLYPDKKQIRYIKKNGKGSLNVKVVNDKTDLHATSLFYKLIEYPWRYCFMLILSYYIIYNLIFGIMFCFLGEIDEDKKWVTLFDAFNFSIQTSETIGYGSLSPHYIMANVLVDIDAFLSFFIKCLISGLIIAKIMLPNRLKSFIRKTEMCVINNKPTSIYEHLLSCIPSHEGSVHYSDKDSKGNSRHNSGKYSQRSLRKYSHEKNRNLKTRSRKNSRKNYFHTFNNSLKNMMGFETLKSIKDTDLDHDSIFEYDKIENEMPSLSFRFMETRPYSKLCSPNFHLYLLKWQYRAMDKLQHSSSYGISFSFNRNKNLEDVEMQIEDLDYEIYMCGDKNVNSGISSTLLMYPFTIKHRITEDSPLFDWYNEKNSNPHSECNKIEGYFFEIIACFEGTDETSGNPLHRVWSYIPDDIKFNYAFHRMTRIDPQEGTFVFDLEMLNKIKIID